MTYTVCPIGFSGGGDVEFDTLDEAVEYASFMEEVKGTDCMIENDEGDEVDEGDDDGDGDWDD